MSSPYFQDHMPGNICFGCGAEHPEGLRIKSRWEGEEAVCHWMPTPKYQGWSGVLNGGILATLIDCHCMGTAMAAVYKAEGRGIDSQPEYRYATGTLNVRYLKPTLNDQEVVLRTEILEIKGRKVVMKCRAYSGETETATADVVAIRVADSSQTGGSSPFNAHFKKKD